MSSEERSKSINLAIKLECTKEDVLEMASMTWIEELAAISILLFGVPGAALSVPALLIGFGLIIGSVWKGVLIGVVILAPLAIVPVKFNEKSLSSWASLQILKYFSYKCIFEHKVEQHQPNILVGPPHGVFPFGNILTMLAFPSIMGFTFKGLAASAAVQIPIFKQIMCTIGVIDASRKSATKALNDNYTIGIATGGVAEVFETNNPDGNEVIILNSRKGMVKLAFQTGASLIPCYLFGNSHLYSLFTGGPYLHSTGKYWSRKIGFALILFWGRFFLPVPYRIPILGVMGHPIQVPKKDNPSQEEIDKVHAELCEKVTALFDKYKAIYGWESKKLIII